MLSEENQKKFLALVERIVTAQERMSAAVQIQAASAKAQADAVIRSAESAVETHQFRRAMAAKASKQASK